MDENLFIITVQESGERIDALLAHNVDILSRSALQNLIEAGAVTVNGNSVKKNYRCSAGDQVELIIPELAEVPLIPQNIPIDIAYEDSDIIVVNKERGMVVHPAPGHPDGTLVNALMFHCGDSLSGIGGERRPGIVHRIDKDTSGLIIAAKNDAAHLSLSSQLSDHSLYREYLAVVRGCFREDSGTVNAPIGRHRTDRKRMAVTEYNSKPAVTHWSVIESYNGYTLIKCILETGRTHQIRVHMSYIGHPLLGDGLYGAPSPEKGLEGQCLHATALHFIHPSSGKQMVLEAPVPEYFSEILRKLGEPIR